MNFPLVSFDGFADDSAAPALDGLVLASGDGLEKGALDGSADALTISATTVEAEVGVSTGGVATGGVSSGWNRITLAIIAAPTLAELQKAALLGALELSGGAAGALSLSRDEFEVGGGISTLKVPFNTEIDQTDIEGRIWQHWNLEWEGASVGRLSLLLDSKDPNPAGENAIAERSKVERSEVMRSIDALSEQIAAVAAKTRMFEQLQHIKREWQAMLDGMIDGVYVCDQEGVILRANRALAAMLGLPIPRVLGQKRDDLWARLPDYTVLRPWQDLEIGPSHLSPQITEFRCDRPDRVFVEMAFELRSVGASVGAPFGADGLVSLSGAAKNENERRLCVLHDVTESRRLQEQLLQSEKLAALGELTSGVAHELNNPLATVVGYAELLDLDKTLPPGVRRKINTIHSEATRASHIVANLLAYARRSSPEKEFVAVNEVLEAAVEMRRYQLHADNVRLITDFAPNLPPVWGDSLQLQQVFLNIINNAVQAVQGWRGSGEIRLTTQATSMAGQAAVRVLIEDNGPGIADEHLRRVFDPFFTTKPTGEGTGLGMSIALRVISNHEGLIWVESRLGHGARFIIELPGAVGSELDIAPLAASPSPGAIMAREGRRILVIDDEEPVVTLISEILALDGHQVTPAFNGAEAIALLNAGDYDLILSDVRMPAVGGPTFFEILQTTRPDLLPRVIFVTGDTMSKSTQEFLQRAGRPVLAKPFDPERLLDMVDDNLRATAA